MKERLYEGGYRLLAALESGPSYAYALFVSVGGYKDRTLVTRILVSFRERGYVRPAAVDRKSAAGPPRRYVEITERGRAALQAYREKHGLVERRHHQLEDQGRNAERTDACRWKP